MKNRFSVIINEIEKTGISKKLLEAKSIEEVRKLLIEFENENKDIISSISDWDLQYNGDKDGYVISVGEDIRYPIAVVLFIYYCYFEDEESLIEDIEILINALNTLDSRFAKALVKFIKNNFMYYFSISNIAKYM